MGSHPEAGVIRLALPAQADFVSVLRVAVRVVATRAGCDDDTRSRLQAAVGSTFFLLLDGSPVDSAVEVLLKIGDRSVALDMRAAGAIDPERVWELDQLDGPHELSDDRRTVTLHSSG